MIHLYLQMILKRKSTYVFLAVLFLIRTVQYITTFQFSVYKDLPITEALGAYFSINNMALVFIPLYCFWVYQSVLCYYQEEILVRFPSRLDCMLAFLKLLAVDSALYTAALAVTVLPFLLVQALLVENITFLLIVLALLWLVMAICSVLFYLVYFWCKKTYLSCIAVVAYGMFDYVLQGVSFSSDRWWLYVGSNAPFLLFDDPMEVYLTRFAILLSALALLLALFYFTGLKADYLRQEKANE